MTYPGSVGFAAKPVTLEDKAAQRVEGQRPQRLAREEAGDEPPRYGLAAGVVAIDENRVLQVSGSAGYKPAPA